jgi:hypothetical protein
MTRKIRTFLKDRPRRHVSSSAAEANDWKLELLGLIGFFISGVIFIVSGIRSGDFFTIFGSAIWTFSCAIWMIPYKKYFFASGEQTDHQNHNT